MVQSTVEFYLVNFPFLLYLSLIYSLFRDGMFEWLRSRKIRSSMKGKQTFWWYKSLHLEYGFAGLYYLNKAFTIIYPITAMLLLLAAKSRTLSIIYCVMLAASDLMAAIMSFFADVQNNKGRVGAGFILFEIDERKKPHSTIFDIIICLFILCYGYIVIEITMSMWNAGV